MLSLNNFLTIDSITTPVLPLYDNLGLDIHQAVIAGGAIRSTICQECPNDIDIFCFSEEKQSNICEKIVALGGHVNLLKNNSSYSATWIYNCTLPHINYPLQVIYRDDINKLESLFKDFDFSVTHFAYANNYIYCPDYALQHLYARKLKFVNVRANVSIKLLKRVLKYTRYGYSLSDEDTVTLHQVIAGISKLSALEDKELQIASLNYCAELNNAF